MELALLGHEKIDILRRDPLACRHLVALIHRDFNELSCQLKRDGHRALGFNLTHERAGLTITVFKFERADRDCCQGRRLWFRHRGRPRFEERLAVKHRGTCAANDNQCDDQPKCQSHRLSQKAPCAFEPCHANLLAC